VVGVKLKKPSILIADDDEAFRLTLQTIFEPRGYEILLAENGRQALYIVRINPVDCLLLDMHMPDLTGLETLQIIRERHATLPCVMLTADASQHVVHRALALRVYTVLTKPVSQELVTGAVRQALESVPTS
jgi:CheY-like chemotaxis protein